MPNITSFKKRKKRINYFLRIELKKPEEERDEETINHFKANIARINKIIKKLKSSRRKEKKAEFKK